MFLGDEPAAEGLGGDEGGFGQGAPFFAVFVLGGSINILFCIAFLRVIPVFLLLGGIRNSHTMNVFGWTGGGADV